jgi:hypothetical protein
MMLAAIAVPIADPFRTERRDGTEAANEDDVQQDVEHRHRHAEDHRRARISGRAQRAAQHEEDHGTARRHEHDAQEGQGFLLHRRRRVDEIEQPRRQEVTEGREDADGEADCDEEGLVHRPVHHLLVAGARVTGDEHAHPAEERHDEGDDDEKDLPAHADGGVAGVSDEMADHHVIDDALHAADDVGEHRGPGELPHRRTQRSLDDGAVVSAYRGRRRHGRYGRRRNTFGGCSHVSHQRRIVILSETKDLLFISSKADPPRCSG